MNVPSVDLTTLSSAVVRPLVVAITHLPILIVAVCAIPVWVMAVVRPATHGELAFRLIAELRKWSRDVIGAVNGGRGR
jgi:hypothetical protein